MENHMGILCLTLVVPLTLFATMLVGVIRFMVIPYLQVSLFYECSLIVYSSCYNNSTFS